MLFINSLEDITYSARIVRSVKFQENSQENPRNIEIFFVPKK
jgi:hypothetical protein